MTQTISVPPIRNIQAVEYQGRYGYWAEMDHPGEGSRQFGDIVDYYLNKSNWKEFITPGSTCIDIGGHSGDTAIPMLLAGAGTVLSMEPNSRIMPYLEFVKNLNLGLGKIILSDLAVTTHAGPTAIYDHSNQLCNGGMIDPTWSPELKQRMISIGHQHVDCSGDTLANICNSLLTPEEIARISVVKTDTEGHDASLLEASADFLDTIRPVIITEWFFAYGPTETQRLFDIIHAMKYVAFDPSTLCVSDINQRTEDLILIHETRLGEFPNLKC